MKKLLFVLIGISLFTVSCKNDDDYVAVSDIDLQLETAMLNASNSTGVSNYILPESDDFTNIPQDANNPLTSAKVELGQLLFNETGLSTNTQMDEGQGTVSCASCHHAGAGFQAGMRQGIGDGGIGFGIAGESRHMNENYTEDLLDIQPIKTPPALNTAYQKLMLWNGQFGATDQNIGTESQWTIDTPKETNNLGFEGVEIQAIAGLTVHRMEVNEALITSLGYKPLFDQVFSNVAPEDRYSLINAGLAIAAFERTILANQAPFQQWLKGDTNALSNTAKQGAILFFEKAACVSCHNGPSLGAMDFMALGMNDLTGNDIMGTLDEATKKGRGGFTQNPEDDYKFKVPQLYSLKYNGSFGHGASFSTLKDLITYKNNALKENSIVPDTALDIRFTPLNLTDEEVMQLTLFIEEGLNDSNLSRYTPDSILSGNCFPNNDPVSRVDLGCD